MQVELAFTSGDDSMTVLCHNFGGRVEGMWDFWYNVVIKKG